MIAPAIFGDLDESSPPDDTAIRWLEGRGVLRDDICRPFPVHVARVIFDDGRYRPAPGVGDFAFVFAVFDEEIVDAAAWEPSTGRMATRLGNGAALGQALIGTAGWGTTGRSLVVRRSPLDWLRSGRRGLVIVDPILAAHILAGRALRAEDDAHRRELKRVLRLPPPAFASDSPPQELAA